MSKLVFTASRGTSSVTIEFEAEKLISSDDIYSFIERLHGNPDDFDSGNLGTRIESYEQYICKIIPLSEINYKLYSVDEDMVNEYAKLKTPIPPILVDENYNIEDGTHRCYAALKQGTQYMYCFVPFN